VEDIGGLICECYDWEANRFKPVETLVSRVD
jgi:hypothetical protein